MIGIYANEKEKGWEIPERKRCVRTQREHALAEEVHRVRENRSMRELRLIGRWNSTIIGFKSRALK